MRWVLGTHSVSEPQSNAVKYLNPTEYSGVGRIEHKDLPVYSDLLLQLSAFPVSFLAGSALEVLILTHSSRLEDLLQLYNFI